jgi:hypothetical protein
MPSTPAPIVPPRPGELQHLLADMAGPKAPAQTASTVAWTWFRRLRALGALRVRLFGVTRAAGRPARPSASAKRSSPASWGGRSASRPWNPRSWRRAGR